MDIPEIHVKVLYDFDYTTKEGRRVWVKEGEKLFLIKKTNSDWWQVIRSGERRPFYVPATYVEEVRKFKDGRRGYGQRKEENGILMLKIGDNSSDEKNGYVKIDNQLNNSSDFQFENITFRPRSNSDLVPCQLTEQNGTTDRSGVRKNPQIAHSQSTIFRNEANPILFDKRKSWAVEELVSELAQMRSKSENGEPTVQGARNSYNESVEVRNGINEPHTNGNTEKSGNVEIRRDKNSLTNGGREDKTPYPDQSPSVHAVNHTPPQQCGQEEEEGTTKAAPDKRPRVKLGPKVKQLSESLDLFHSEDKSPPYKFAQQLLIPNRNDKSRKKSEDSVSSSEGIAPHGMLKKLRDRARSSSSGKSKTNKLSTPEKEVNRSKESLTESNYSSSSSESGFKERNRSEERKHGDGTKVAALAFQNQLYCANDNSGNNRLSGEVNMSGSFVSFKSRAHSEETTTDSQPMTEGEADFSDSEVSNKSDETFLSKPKTDAHKWSGKVEDHKTPEKKSGPVYANLPIVKSPNTPPSPRPEDTPSRLLTAGWAEYRDSGGRSYYYNTISRERSWKPPRRRQKLDTSLDGKSDKQQSGSSSPLGETDETTSNYIDLPSGWRESFDDTVGQTCYINEETGAKVNRDDEDELSFTKEYLRGEGLSRDCWEGLRIPRCSLDEHSASCEVQASGSEDGGVWEDNPLFRELQGGGSPPLKKRSAFRKLCKSVREDLEDLLQPAVNGCSSDDWDDVSLCNSRLSLSDEELRRNSSSEFLELCGVAEKLANESIEECKRRSKDRTFLEDPGRMSLVSVISDEVFLPSERSFDINSIFDDGSGDPPVPPLRRKRRASAQSGNSSVYTFPGRALFSCESTDTESITFHDQDRSGRREAMSDATLTPGSAVPARVDYSEICVANEAGSICVEVTPVSPQDATTDMDPEPSCSPEEDDDAFVKTCVESLGSTLVDDWYSSIDSGRSYFSSRSDVDTEISLKTRKGSSSSDIVAWKQELHWECYDDEDWTSSFQSDEWFSSNDCEGRVYFFEENSNESSWTLPEVNVTLCDSSSNRQGSPQSCDSLLSKSPLTDSGEPSPTEEGPILRENVPSHLTAAGLIERGHRVVKTRSMVLIDPRRNDGRDSISSKSSSMPRNLTNWPQLWDGNMCVLKEGQLNRTKITENGKKLRKNWSSSHVVLTELFLLLFKDVKSFLALKAGTQGSRPELCVDLNGALIDRGEKLSSRKNVFVISTVLGLQVLFQDDNAQVADEWYKSIECAIQNLPSRCDSQPRNKITKDNNRLFVDSNSPEESKKFPRIGRSKSVKLKKDGSIEDLSVTPAERQTKIKARLRKFFVRRPTMESLVKKGIWKDEPVFGCYLDQICAGEHPKVPLFVQKCIEIIEMKEENMKTDGLYRASGNLSQVQKIRLQVDQNNLSIMEQEEDIHVLTGALKMFFRELKEPLIPYELFDKALRASTNMNKKEKVHQFREIVKALPTANHDTLKFLLQHLLRVTEYQDHNRMHIPNLAIVFGPTLMWPEHESLNMALDLMQQNLVIECFLQEFNTIFR